MPARGTPRPAAITRPRMRTGRSGPGRLRDQGRYGSPSSGAGSATAATIPSDCERNSRRVITAHGSRLTTHDSLHRELADHAVLDMHLAVLGVFDEAVHPVVTGRQAQVNDALA